MTNDPIQVLLEYIDLLEKALEDCSPDRLLQLANKRQGLLRLLQKQRELIGTLQTAHQDDQAQIAELRAEIASLRSESKVAQAEHQDRPNADRE